MTARAVAPEEMCRRCDEAILPFATTADLPPLEAPLGQERASEAIRFGMGIRREGFNVFALGPPGLGKRSLVLRLLRERAAGEATPDDWCYVFNFRERQHPLALRLPPGRGAALRRDAERLV